LCSRHFTITYCKKLKIKYKDGEASNARRKFCENPSIATEVQRHREMISLRGPETNLADKTGKGGG